MKSPGGFGRRFFMRDFVLDDVDFLVFFRYNGLIVKRHLLFAAPAPSIAIRRERRGFP
jgi:hypothetical protein